MDSLLVVLRPGDGDYCYIHLEVHHLWRGYEALAMEDRRTIQEDININHSVDWSVLCPVEEKRDE